MRAVQRLFSWLNLFSIDVAAGAVICAWFFAGVLDVDVHVQAYVALGLSVWIIYTVDHLLDARRLTTTASTARHKVHQRHFKLLALLTILAAIADVVAVILIRKPLLMAGLQLSFLIALYLLVQRYLTPFKEFCGGIFYTAGVTMPALVFGYTHVTIPIALVITQFLFTTWINLLLFSLLDYERDKLDNHISFTTKMGEQKTRIVIVVLFAACVILGFYQLFFHNGYAGSILLVMDIILFVVMLKRNHFANGETFRLIGDAVFLIPLLYILK